MNHRSLESHGSGMFERTLFAEATHTVTSKGKIGKTNHARQNHVNATQAFAKAEDSSFSEKLLLGRAAEDLAGHTARDSLVREELQGAAARGDLAHGVTATLAEPCCCWRLVVDVHRRVSPLCWWGT